VVRWTLGYSTAMTLVNPGSYDNDMMSSKCCMVIWCFNWSWQKRLNIWLF